MPDPKLIIEGRAFPLASGTNSLGRSSDNDIAFSRDSNVSRYHAEIEVLGEESWLIDLGSANGTTLNRKPVDRRERLLDGDEIVLGGSSAVRFDDPSAVSRNIEEDTQAEAAAASAPSASASPVSEGLPGRDREPAGFRGLMIAAGAVGVVALLVIVGAAAFYFTRPAPCNAKATIISPEDGDTLLEPTDVDIDVSDQNCVGTVAFKIDGVEFATLDVPPFSTVIDPKDYPDLSDGFEHNLAVELADLKGKKLGTAASIRLVFETRSIERSVTNDRSSQQRDAQPTGKSKELSLIEVQEMAKRLTGQLSGGFKYNVSNKDFLTEVRKRTGEYARDGFFQRASRYRDVINVAYAREQNVDAALGFILAMSRSNFIAAKKGDEEGLWRMSGSFVTDNAYNGLCGSEPLSDPAQNCAAKASALYMKAIVYGVFEGDPIYSAVAFGKSPQDAGSWKATLPRDRTDLWMSIRTPDEREQLVRFFAAGIVAENPQKFGLEKDRPLSELYKLTM